MITSKLILTKRILLSVIFFFIFSSFPQAEILQKTTSGESSEKIDGPWHLLKLDTLFVIHFHPTVQCSCCINVGNFAKKGLEKYYAKPYKDGRIIFKEYNIDEDSSTAKRYKIFWSALGFEKCSKEKNEFKEIESVWEFCEDEKKFLLNFKKELDEFMSGAKDNKSEDENTKSDVGKPASKRSK